MAFYVNSSTIGADLNNTSTVQLFTLGTMLEGSDGTIWEYTQAATSVSAFAVVAINSSGTMAMCSVTDAVSGRQLAVAQNAFAASDFGWVPIHGTGGASTTFKVLCSSTMSGGNAMYIGTETGKLSIQASGSATIHGIVVFAASGSDVATVTSLACVISWPKCNFAGN